MTQDVSLLSRRCCLPEIRFALVMQVCLLARAVASLSCLDADGAPRDWWIALKAPGVDWSGNTKFGYLDSSSVDNGSYVWREGTHISRAEGNPPAETLRPLYEQNTSSVGYVMWNDEPGQSHCPHGCTSFLLGHSKGVLGFSESGGFLLSHSVPKYPDSPVDGEFGGIRLGQLLNGQSFLCVSLSPQHLDELGEALQTANLNIFTPHSFPSDLLPRYRRIHRLLKQALPRWGPVKRKAKVRSLKLQTQGRQELQIFLKSSTGPGGQAVRMWEDVVERGLGAGMFVQSWPEGRTRDLPSFCGPPDSDFESLTITNISIPGTRLSWQTRASRRFHDHGKWAVTVPQAEVPAFCGGDNNRAGPQSFRGGLAVCFIQNTALHIAMSTAVASVQPCSKAGDVQ